MVLLVFVNFLPIPIMAWATMATATSFNPWIQVKLESLLINNAEKTISIITEGSIKPIKEIIPPRIPPLIVPIPIPTWLLAGPGKNWHSATKSEYSFSSSHFLFLTYSS